MNSYFFKMTNEEKNNILTQHKEIYDGYVTQYASSNEQPLYVQDYANDKGGVTISNKGNVTTYRNMNINEDVFSGTNGVPEQNIDEDDDSTYVSLGEKLDMIGDGDHDLPNGTVDVDDVEVGTEFLLSPDFDLEDEDNFEFMGDNLFDDEDQENEWDTEDKSEYNSELDDLLDGDDFDDEDKIKISNQISESINMFSRLKKYI
jgi:hypothetical protein